MDGCLTAGNRQVIIDKFGLSGIPVEVKRDEHYQCAKCNREYLE
jgi:hypothetical protein